MSILDNEGHDPNGLGNRPTWDNRPGINGVLERKDAEIARLRAALRPFAEAITSAETQDGDDPNLILQGCRAHVTLYEFAVARRVLEQKQESPARRWDDKLKQFVYPEQETTKDG